eukprot:Colp12_sorted_trinity150504_noHs@4353
MATCTLVTNNRPIMEENTFPCKLNPEVEEGNTEYKLKLVNPTSLRLEHLITQMKWRLEEGNGEAFYEIGVEDNGTLAGLSETDMEASLQTLSKMASRLGAKVEILRKQKFEEKAVAEIRVRRSSKTDQFTEVRVAVLGNVDAGKSTVLGVLSRGELDNGRGKSRLATFRHKHEIETGRTSSISYELLGFSPQGEPVSVTGSQNEAWELTGPQISKVVTMIDLAGHHKYLKTTVSGLTCHQPDYTLLTVAANAGLVGMGKEHLGLAVALNMPLVVVVTKVDVAMPAQRAAVLHQLTGLLKSPSCRRNPLVVNTEAEAVDAAKRLHQDRLAPIIMTSSVTGQGIPVLRSFLHALSPSPPPTSGAQSTDGNLCMHIGDVFTVAGVGKVVSGTILSGQVSEGDEVLVGPDVTGSFVPARVRTIHRKRTPYKSAKAGQTASIAMDWLESPLSMRKGMVVSSVHPPPPHAWNLRLTCSYSTTPPNSRRARRSQCISGGCGRQPHSRALETSRDSYALGPAPASGYGSFGSRSASNPGPGSCSVRDAARALAPSLRSTHWTNRLL